MTNDGGPAFPVIGAPGAPEDYPGMSLRDWFAGQALAGMLMSESSSLLSVARLRAAKERGIDYTDQLSLESYAIADAMLAERDKEH